MAILLPEERLGQRVADRYRLDAILSAGGMGVLFEGLDEAACRPVAVKMLKPAYALEPGRVARFLRETRIAVRLRHPHIATVLDVWTDEAGTPFLIMELLKGRSLAKELEGRGTLSIGEALAIAVPVGHALAAAHAMDVIHRDIKPGNIFLCRDFCGEGDAESATSVVPKLLDFGIAKSIPDDFETETGMLLGTPGYMAPEQLLYAECGPFTDVWGLGAVLYRCLMGRPPHAGESVAEVLRRLIGEPVAPVDAPGVNRAVCATIDRALAREPHRRYPSMNAFVHALQAAATHDTAGSTTLVTSACEELASESDPPPLAPAAHARPNRGRFRVATPWTAALLASALLLVEGGPDGVSRFDGGPRAGRVRLPEPAPVVAPERRTHADEASWQATGLEPEPASAQAAAPRSGFRPPHSARRVPPPAYPAPIASSSASLPEPVIMDDTEREATTGLPIITRW